MIAKTFLITARLNHPEYATHYCLTQTSIGSPIGHFCASQNSEDQNSDVCRQAVFLISRSLSA